MKKKLISLLLVGAMVASMAACGGNNGEAVDGTESGATSTSAYNTLVVGVQSLDGVFSPFFYTSGYDAQAGIDPVFASVFASRKALMRVL